MTHYVTVIGYHAPTEDVWHTTSELEVGAHPPDVIDAAVRTAVDANRGALVDLIPGQYLPAVEWYARVEQSPPPLSESPPAGP